MGRKEVRIVSDSSYVTGVKVFVGDTIMDNITEIKIRMLPESFIEAEIKVLVSELNFEADGRITEICPRCNETLDGNDKLSKLKRLAENLVAFEKDHEEKDFKKYAIDTAKYFLKEIERD